MSYLPCKNPNCKSEGKPHPNCKCYGGLADGGDVHFCATARGHQPDCEYFAEGGDVIPEGFTLEGESPNQEEPIPDGFKLEGEEELPPGFALEDEGKQPGEDSAGLAGLEGAVKGFLGPVGELVMRTAPVIVGSELITPEARAARAKANPGTAALAETVGLVGGMLTGSGLAGAAAKTSEAITGSKILQQAIQGGLIQASDEVSKWAMGEGSPEDAAGASTAVGAAFLFSGLLGAGSKYASKGAAAGLEKIAESKFGESATSFLHGIAAAAKGAEPEVRAETLNAVKGAYGMSSKAFKAGMQAFDKFITPAAGTIGALEGYRQDGVLGAVEGLAAGLTTGLIGKKFVAAPLAKKYMAPALLWMLSKGSVNGAAEAFDHVANLAHGSKMVNGAVESIFKGSPVVSSLAVRGYGGKNLKDDLDTFLGNGGTAQSLQQDYYDQNSAPEPQGFAEGGEVKKKKSKPDAHPTALRPDNGVAIHYPAQNMLLNTAKARVSGYLSGLRPAANQPKLPFDDEPDDRKKKKDYHRAMDIAIQPLSVMHEIQKGTVEPEHIKHLTAMYPELATMLQKKVTEQILKHQVDGKKPPYKIRQGLSMLMGTALSSEMTPQSIQAAQAVFLKQGPQQPPAQSGQKSSGNKSKLSKADQAYLTGSQARQKRAQRDT